MADGLYELRALHSGKLLEAPNGSRVLGGHVWQRSADGAASQLWHMTQDHGEWRRIRNAANWLYLDADAKWPDVCPILMNPLNEQTPDIQLWRIEAVDHESGTYRVTNKAKDVVLDFVLSLRMSNEHLLAYPWNGKACQQWLLQGIPFLTGEYRIAGADSGKRLDVSALSRAAGAVPCQSDASDSPSQRWRLIHRGDACYQVQNTHSDLVIQAAKKPALSVALTQSDPDAGDAQLWRIECVGPGVPQWRLVSKALGTVLEVGHESRETSDPLQLGDWSGELRQLWGICECDT
jgi:hypothetical protein